MKDEKQPNFFCKFICSRAKGDLNFKKKEVFDGYKEQHFSGRITKFGGISVRNVETR